MSEERRAKLDDCKSLEEIEEFLTGVVSEHHLCIDCGFNTAPGHKTKKEIAREMWEARQRGETWSDPLSYNWDCEIYMVRERVGKTLAWKATAVACVLVVLKNDSDDNCGPRTFCVAIHSTGYPAPREC